jgi:hypothetical protein
MGAMKTNLALPGAKIFAECVEKLSNLNSDRLITFLPLIYPNTKEK